MTRITKTEIAKMYGVSRPTLMKWIINRWPLIDELEELGYNQDLRVLSPVMLEKIIDYLGEPLYPLGGAPEGIKDKTHPPSDENATEK
jgi:hypothetical protein